MHATYRDLGVLTITCNTIDMQISDRQIGKNQEKVGAVQTSDW